MASVRRARLRRRGRADPMGRRGVLTAEQEVRRRVRREGNVGRDAGASEDVLREGEALRGAGAMGACEGDAGRQAAGAAGLGRTCHEETQDWLGGLPAVREDGADERGGAGPPVDAWRHRAVRVQGRGERGRQPGGGRRVRAAAHGAAGELPEALDPLGIPLGQLRGRGGEGRRHPRAGAAPEKWWKKPLAPNQPRPSAPGAQRSAPCARGPPRSSSARTSSSSGGGARQQLPGGSRAAHLLVKRAGGGECDA